MRKEGRKELKKQENIKERKTDIEGRKAEKKETRLTMSLTVQ
jgi:hypothetical protein